MATNEFTSHKTEQVFKMKFAASCKSSNIVYLVTCRTCSQQYVVETGQLLHQRINCHCFDIKQRRTEESPVAEHFDGKGDKLAVLTVEVIDQLYSHDSWLRKIRESRWIRTLGTSHLFGMNIRVDCLWSLSDDYLLTPWNSVLLIPRLPAIPRSNTYCMYLTSTTNIMCTTAIMYWAHRSWGWPHRRPKPWRRVSWCQSHACDLL